MEKRVKKQNNKKVDLKNTCEATFKMDRKPEKLRVIELWLYNEYNDGSIIASSSNIKDIIKKAHDFVTESNVENALTLDEKNNQWETYFVDIFEDKKISEKTFYAGNKRDGKHYVYSYENNEWKIRKLSSDDKIKIFLGDINRGKIKDKWYLSDHKGKEIVDISNQNLDRKAVLFIKVV